MNLRSTLCLMALACAAPVRAGDSAPPQLQAAPSVELGLGAVVLTVPDYRGSDQYDVQAYPVPYVVYRSDRVQLSRDGLRARLFTIERLTLSVSGALNLTSHRDNPDRRDMPQLAPSIEIGPSFDYRVDEGEHWSVRVRLPARAAISTEGARWLGAVVAPHVRVDFDQHTGMGDLFYLATFGGLWGSNEYHQYFYGVATQYAQAGRPAYDAPAGYSGMRASLSATVRLGKWRLSAFMANDWLEGVAFEGSPLLKTRDNVSGGVLIAYRLYSRGPEYLRDDDSP